MRRLLLLLLTCFTIATSDAAPLPPTARLEIDGLLARLETSKCEFQRNGTWHDAGEAKSHLLRKLQYLEERGAVDSTEQFIDRAASKSSLSGQPYQVRCANGAPVNSQAWLTSQLALIRAAARTPRPP